MMETKELIKPEKKKEIDSILAECKLPHIPITYYGHDGFFVPTDNVSDAQLDCAISVITCNKDYCIVYPYQIVYIAIEDRKSVLYLTDGKIETNYRIDHWKNILDENYFAQPHYSYIVNLNYVAEVTTDFVIVKYMDTEYKVYTSSRKIASFRKAFLNFNR